MVTVVDERTGETLRRLNPDQIEIGKPLPGALCDAHGNALAPAGRTLNGNDVKRLRAHVKRGVYGGAGWPESTHLVTQDERPTAKAKTPAPIPTELPAPHTESTTTADRQNASAPEGLVPLALDSLFVGKTLTHPVFNRQGVLLLAAGMEVTHRFLGRLRQQGVVEVHMPANIIAEQYQPTAGRIRIERELDNLVEHLRRTEISIGNHRVPRRDLNLADLRAETERGGERFVRSVDDVAEITSDIHRGRASTVSGANDVLTPFMEMITTDSSLLPAVTSLKRSAGEYLYQHGLNVALLSMAAAARLGVRKEILLEIGLGALLQDVGMLRIDESIRMAPRALTPEERLLINEHPHYSLDLLQRIEGLGSISMLVCYQSHERNDGSGYPHRRPRHQIHPYARLVAAADVYTAIGSARPYRDAMSPYRAMESVLRNTSNGLLDVEVMRNFLDGVALFPIGSMVRLSTGEMARVLRANPGRHTMPVVVLQSESGGWSDVEIDLAETRYAKIIEALDAPIIG